MLKTRFSAILSIICASLFSAQTSVGAPAPRAKSLSNTVVLIIRHAEKPDSGDGLTEAGERRAAAYVQYFKSYQLNGEPLRLTHIFAAHDSKASHRPRLTIEPLAMSLHQNLDLRFTDKDPDALVQDLKSENLGNEILICWRHGKIPALLSALGVDPSKFVPEGRWPEGIYDRVIELHFDSQGQINQQSSRLVKEHLFSGDEK
ncbi:MAG TPA: hypothetical protein VGL56_12230 [Fimbriimonadaceae bacterium]